MKRVKRVFDQSFKVEAVKLVIEQGYQVKEAADNLGIGLSTLAKWIRAYKKDNHPEVAFPGKGNLRPHDAELKNLQKELERVKRERDILKKALGYFANPQG